MESLELRDWGSLLNKLKCPCSEFLINGVQKWYFPLSDFEIFDDDFRYGMLYSFEGSTTSFSGVVPHLDFSVIAVATSGEVLVMELESKGRQCYWLGVGFEHHAVGSFRELLGPPVGSVSNVVKKLSEDVRYIPPCHKRFEDW